MDNIQQLEDELSAAQTPLQKIRALNLLGRQLRSRDARRSLELAQTAAELGRAGPFPKEIADSLANQAECHCYFGDFVAAVSGGLEALQIYQQLDDRAGQADVLCSLCWAHLNLDNFSEAVELGRQAQKLARETGNRTQEAVVLNHLGGNYKRAGNYELAITVYEESLALFRALGDDTNQCVVLANIVFICNSLEQYDRALLAEEQFFRLEKVTNIHQGYLFVALAEAYRNMKAYDKAQAYLQRAISLANQVRVDRLSVAVLREFGRVYIQLEQPELAISSFLQSLAVAEKLESKFNVFTNHKMLAEIYERLGDPAQALFHFKQFHAVKEAVFNDKNISRLQILEIQHSTEIARRDAEIYHLRTVELEQEIVERKRVERELAQKALTDELTGISNRRHFMGTAQQELKRAVRLNRPVTLVLMDIDHFKQINDTCGHASGDQALRAFTSICKKNIREIDLFARLGGDEFALLFPETDCDQTLQIMERIRQNLLVTPLECSGGPVSMTISAGVVGLLAEAEDLDSLLARADRSMYLAKEAGRDRIVVGQD